MKKNLIIYLTVIGLIGLFSACEKDETRTVMSGSPTVPTIQTIPDLTLTRATGNEILTFVGTPVDPGFQASVIYYLEACPSGNNFANVTSILSSPQDAELKISVADLNGILLKSFPADATSTVDFRIRSVLVADAGTGVKPLMYNSPTKPAEVTLYGLPRLNLIGSGMDQKIESALGDGKYTGFVKLNVANPFTLQDPDFNKTYGGTAGVLAENGPALTVDPLIGSGWYKLNANTTALTYSYTPNMIGLIGSATPNGWNTPDQKMDYDAATGTWKITVTLTDGMIKFRLNDAWAWNLGGTYDKLTVDGPDMPVAAGNYTIVLTITNPNSVKGEVGGFCTVTKN
jgi:hypothetical protein